MSSNLLKQYYVSVDFEKARVIDTNDLVEKKIAELNRKMHQSVKDRGLDEFEAGFTDGIEAIRVAELLEDDGADAMGSGIMPQNPVYEGPSEEEIQQMIEERLQEANAQAEEIVKAAHNEADNIRKQAHSEGSRKGYDEGKIRAQAEFQAKENELLQKEKQLEKEFEAKVNQLEPLFVDTITNVYEQIFNVELSEYQDMLIYLVESVIKKNDEDTQFMVHVSPTDFKKVYAKKAELLSKIIRDNIKIEIIEDVTVGDKQCIIETENGIYDCGIDTQLEELKKRLRALAYQKN